MDEINDKIAQLSLKIASAAADADLLYQRGKLYWKLGQKAAAMTDFNAAVALDPASPAAAYLRMANEIMNFYNTDLYNP